MWTDVPGVSSTCTAAELQHFIVFHANTLWSFLWCQSTRRIVDVTIVGDQIKCPPHTFRSNGIQDSLLTGTKFECHASQWLTNAQAN